MYYGDIIVENLCLTCWGGMIIGTRHEDSANFFVVGENYTPHVFRTCGEICGLVEVQARGLDAKRNLWAKHLQEAATWKRDPAPPRQFHVGLVQDAAHSARMLKAVWLIGSRHLEQVAAALHAWQVLAIKVSRCRNEVSHELGLRVRLVVLAKEMQMAHRHLAAAGTIPRSLESKIQLGAKLRMPSLELQDLFAAWWSLTAEAKLDVWNAAAVSISAQLGGHSSCTSMLLREHAETFAAPESFSTSSECGGSEYSEPDYLQTDAGWQLGSCSVGVECSQHDSWDSQGWKGWFLLPLAFRAWRGTTLMQQQQLCSARYKAYLWDNFICCFIAWELLVVRGRALHSKLAGSCRLQDRHCLDVFTAWKTVLLESRGKRASLEALCKLKCYSNHAVRSCWNAWYSTRDTGGLAWRGVVIGMLRQQGRQRALECLVDAMDARSEREHTERSMALQQRADKLLIDLVFVVWKSACETSQLRHRLDKTGLTANDAVTDLVTYHSQAARLAAMSSIFAGWSIFARLQRQRQRCSRNIDKQYRQGNAETLGCCLFAWRQISFCAQYRGKLEVCSARRWDTLLSSRCFYLWMQIARWMHASQGVDETGSCLKLAGSCRLQDRRCLDVFTAWKTVLLEGRGKRASLEVLCKLKCYSNHAVRSCWNAWYSTRDTGGLAWRGVVIGMLRQQGRQRALECLVDAMDARSEREHTERSMALQQRADKLLIDLVFVIWKSACETSRLRHRLDKTGLTANDAVTDLVTYHSQAARLAAMSSIFAGWSMFARLQRQRQRCSRNIDKQYRQGNAETLGCCLFAWQQVSFCAQYRGKLEVCSARRWDTLLSSRCFYLWMQIARWMHASQGVDETGSRAGFQHAAESRADVLVELCTRGLLVPHPLVRDAIRYAFLAWKSEHLQANLLAVQGSEAGRLFVLQRSCGLVHLALHAWWHLQLKQRTSSAHLQRLETLLSRTTMEQYFRRWLLYSFCPSKLLPWVRIVLSLRAEVKFMCRTSSDVQADQALSVPKEEVAVLRQVPAAQAGEVTDEEEQPEEEQVPAVYQPIMTPANGPLAGHCTRSSSSSSNLDSVQRPAISNVEDLHRRLYVEQASLMRWWDMSLAGQLRLVELRAPLVERHACPESRLPAASHPDQLSRQRAASSSLVRPAGRAACLARLLQEAETAALHAVKVSASGAGHAHKENMLENDIAPTPAKAEDDERRWGDETWLLAKSRQPAVVPVQLHWGLKGTKDPVTPASGTKEPVTRAALLAASQI
ncbi:unnamed protein product [Symbiodinium sp. KB8]|nr:unnamed protein product [Symbiodinium sp. KB8]